MAAEAIGTSNIPPGTALLGLTSCFHGNRFLISMKWSVISYMMPRAYCFIKYILLIDVYHLCRSFGNFDKTQVNIKSEIYRAKLKIKEGCRFVFFMGTAMALPFSGMLMLLL